MTPEYLIIVSFLEENGFIEGNKNHTHFYSKKIFYEQKYISIECYPNIYRSDEVDKVISLVSIPEDNRVTIYFKNLENYLNTIRFLMENNDTVKYLSDNIINKALIDDGSYRFQSQDGINLVEFKDNKITIMS